MICSPVVHTSLDVAAQIEGVVYYHRDMLSTLRGLNVQMELMRTTNRRLTERVKILEVGAEEKRIVDEHYKLLFDNTVAALQQQNKALQDENKVLTDRLTVLEHNTEVKRITEKKPQAADEKRVANCCAELIKNHAEFPLHEEATVGHRIDVLDHLIVHHNYNVNSKDSDGSTPLHCAADCGHITIVEHLLNKGADINAIEVHGSTPLHFAAKSGHTNIVEYLLNWGAEVNAKEVHGSTPLHFAAVSGHANIAEYLLNWGAEVNSRDASGMTPLRLAQKNQRSQVMYLLKSRGGTR